MYVCIYTGMLVGLSDTLKHATYTPIHVYVYVYITCIYNVCLYMCVYAHKTVFICVYVRTRLSLYRCMCAQNAGIQAYLHI